MVNTCQAKMEKMEACDGEVVGYSGFQTSQQFFSFRYRNSWNFASIQGQFHDVVVGRDSLSIVRQLVVVLNVGGLQGVQ